MSAEMEKKIDRRTSPRIKEPMALKITLNYLPGQFLEDETYSIDIGSGGLYFLSNIDLRPGDRFQVKIIPLLNSLVEFGMTLNTSAVVLRSRKIKESKQQVLVAAQFQSPPQWSALSEL
jgi:hypothetical protein